MKNKIIKQIKLAPVHIQAQVDSQIELALYKYFAKVTPEMLEQFSTIVKRKIEELDDVKDTEDYNMDIVSEIIDRGACIFMMAGQKKSYYGDIMRGLVANKAYIHSSLEAVNYLDAKESDDYSIFPFSMTVAGELRSKFVLQTEKTDNYRSLILKLENLIVNYITFEEWEKIKGAIKKAEVRIGKEELLFLNPSPSFEHSELIELSTEELSKYGITRMEEVLIDENTGKEYLKQGKKAFVDKRLDTHDLLSLKDLVLILDSKKEFEYNSIGPGFFAKYMPELKEAGIDGIIFKVLNNQLEEIKLVTQFRNAKPSDISFSPVAAAVMVAQQYACRIEGTEIKYRDMTQGGIEVVHHDKEVKNIDEFFIKENERYYIVVDGMVASPSIDNFPVDYEKNALNNKQIAAGEVFVFEKRSKGYMATRLYFTPYKPSELHILHQHGSVVFGNNDQSLHSCSKLQTATRDEYVDYMGTYPDGMKGWEDKKEMYSPAVIAALLHDVRTGGMYPTDLFLDQYKAVWNNVALSIYEMSYFTAYYEITKLWAINTLYSSEKFSDLMKKMLNNYSPLTKRFLLKNYIKNGVASEKIQPTWYNHVAEERMLKESINTIDMIARLGEIDKLMLEHPNLSFDEIKKMAKLTKKEEKKEDKENE